MMVTSSNKLLRWVSIR